ncbi:RNA polymerase sigma factor [Sorangium cellulosum]|uniref:RNA polymerase sigma factor n=1 Tax=Sorangium cellulosum TaxID=56 RepID=UPI001F2F23D4|nr:hypothetical protein [Sorangium cellulosum]
MSHDASTGAGADGTAAALALTAKRAPADAGPLLAAGAPDGVASSDVPADDAALVRRLLAGDEQAFERLVTQLHTPMLRLARTLAGPAGAQEIVQETWAAVFVTRG